MKKSVLVRLTEESLLTIAQGDAHNKISLVFVLLWEQERLVNFAEYKRKPRRTIGYPADLHQTKAYPILDSIRVSSVELLDRFYDCLKLKSQYPVCLFWHPENPAKANLRLLDMFALY